MKGLSKVIGIVFALGGLCSTASTAQAQSARYYHFSVGLQVGTTHYQGDLDDHGFEPWRGGSNAFKQKLFRPAFGLQVNYHFNPYMFFRFQLNQGWIQASDSLNTDPARRWRNLHFQSPITEGSLQFVFEINSKNDYYRYRSRFTPYIFIGISLFHFNPQAEASADWRRRFPRLFPYKEGLYDLQPLGTEGQNLPAELRKQFGIPDPYSLWSIGIPIGVGFRVRLHRYWDLRADVSIRKTFTDYMDDVSGPKYANPDLLQKYAYNIRGYLFADRSGYANFGNGRGGAITPENMRRHYGAYGFEGEIRGNKNDNDMYGFIHIGITRILK
jgi:hypothetical protein